jgi:hypothetical protein
MNAVNCTERVSTRKFTRKVQFADAHCSLRHPCILFSVVVSYYYTRQRRARKPYPTVFVRRDAQPEVSTHAYPSERLPDKHLSSVPQQKIDVWPEPFGQHNLPPLKRRKCGLQKIILAGEKNPRNKDAEILCN